MRVLIVDDWSSRHDRIRSVLRLLGYPATGITSLSSPAQVSDEDLDVAVCFLDHDMCQRDNDGECPNATEQGASYLDPGCGCPTGLDLVKRMAELTYRPKVIVHTANPVGGPQMCETLRDHGFEFYYAPISLWSDSNLRNIARACKLI